MKKLVQLVVGGLLLALPLAVSAQENGGLDINGEYDVTGAYADGSEPYTGTITFDGFGSVYKNTGSYSYDAEPKSDSMLLLGNTMVDAYGNPACSETAYVRDSDGLLMGLWLDPVNGNQVGVEVVSPIGATADFVGSYAIRGLDPLGTPYTGMVDIALGENGVYTLTYNYPAYENSDALVAQGVGFLSGTVLGVALTLDPAVDPAECALLVGQFPDASGYTATWYQGGLVGAETATRR